MSDRVFLDTNVLVYLFDGDSPDKRDTSRRLLEKEGESGTIVLSTQVLQELYVTVTRKLGKPLPEEEAEKAVRDLCAFPIVAPDADMVLRSIALSRRHKLSLWDSLVVTAAASAGCKRLLSEDLQAGRTIDGVRIENPYAS